MQFVNKNVNGRQDVGHIDLLSKMSYIEVPENDVQKVMDGLNGTDYKGRTVRCNDADEGGHGGSRSSGSRVGRRDSRGGDRDSRGGSRAERPARRSQFGGDAAEKKEDWRELMDGKSVDLKGETPDFSEEGWARRKPKKK